MNTYNDVYLKARKKLRTAGIAAHDLEARLIVAHAAGKTREELLSQSRLFIPDNTIPAAVDTMIERRIAGEPVAYIVGEWDFFGLPLTVNDKVMIPRVDTEVLAELAIKLMKQRGEKIRLLDICAGSGALGLAVAAHVPDCRVVLTDNSDRAVAICRVNMLRNKLSRNVTAIVADALEMPPALFGAFDAIISNPPYIPTGDIDSLDSSVKDYEPLAALDGGHDGLVFFRAIAGNWSAVLKQGGYLAFECGVGQALAVRGIMEDSGFADIRTCTDTLGIDRVVLGIWK